MSIEDAPEVDTDTGLTRIKLDLNYDQFATLQSCSVEFKKTLNETLVKLMEDGARLPEAIKALRELWEEAKLHFLPSDLANRVCKILAESDTEGNNVSRV